MRNRNIIFCWSTRLLCLAGLLGAVDARAQASRSFTNANLIEISELGIQSPYPATPYPSTITVSGVTGTVTKVTVTLRHFAHAFPADVDMLLVGPGGQNSVLMSDAGGSFPVSNVTLTFDDAQPGIPPASPLSSGSFGPRDFGSSSSDLYPPPAPSGPYMASLSVFNSVNPNGVWRLYIVDDIDGDVGSIDDGWSITLTQQADCCEMPPVLKLIRNGATLILKWPATPTGYGVVTKSALDPALLWNPIVNPVITVNGTNSVVVDASTGRGFFRLRK